MSESPWCYLDAPALTDLDLASVLVCEILDTPYLVGSCLDRPDYRDVDIRVILDDARFDALFPRPALDPLRHLIEKALTEHYVTATGLRIDFQIQRQTEANAKYPGVRHPLGVYPINSGGR
ncbi:hypothetical protein ACFYVR_15880 [Rhodococcus sp. NPDC003318]|uniref:hypothetical protein n=1 Tax=Rhodococcus sp. NPDC003318 TaxID=3364503 RepID=UPI003686A99B